LVLIPLPLSFLVLLFHSSHLPLFFFSSNRRLDMRIVPQFSGKIQCSMFTFCPFINFGRRNSLVLVGFKIRRRIGKGKPRQDYVVISINGFCQELRPRSDISYSVNDKSWSASPESIAN